VTAGDPAPEGGWLDDEERDAWLGVVALLLRLPALLETQLRRDAGMSLYEYLVISSLSMTEDRTARMSHLAGLTNGSPSRLSNVVKSLEARGWVTRCPDTSDRRSTLARLTDEGYRAVVAAAPGHVDEVRRRVVAPLTREQLVALAEIATRLVGTVEEAVPTSGDAC
jgi:DNA-binding MarR family transcriptional regulator